MAHDLLIVADATASMSTYLASLNTSLPEVIRISALTGCFERIGIVAYRDYNGGKIVEWSGWFNVSTSSAANVSASSTVLTPTSNSLNRAVKSLTLANTSDQDLTTTREQLLAFARSLRAEFGGDWPEATKTGLAKAHEVMRTEVETIILLYADAPPHMPCTGGSNREKERAALGKKASFGGSGPLFVDWVTACNTLAGRASDKDKGQGQDKDKDKDQDKDQDKDKDTTSMAKRARVFSIIQSPLADTLAPYVLLAHMSGGATLQIANATSSSISQISLAVLLAWMGIEKQAGKSESHAAAAKVATLERYKEFSWLDSLTSETDEKAAAYLVEKDIPHMVNKVKDNLVSTDVSLDTLKNHIKPSDTTQTINFSKRYTSDAAYRPVVIDSLTDIIESDVTAMAVNPVFGSLWRTVCNDRSSEYRDKLIEIFGRAIERIANPDKKAQMKAWLEESYDYAGEIESLVASVSAEEGFPCVYLDPTADFTAEDGAADDEEAPKTTLTREELLEIGRSCDYRILRRLGRVLTCLSYVATEADMPEHIRSADPKISTIPLVLASQRYHRKFWKVLLHLVLPGTMLSARPAALLAALSLRIGLAPLRDVADAELVSYTTWNNLEIPETWNTNCLALLLEADSNYRSRHDTAIPTKRLDGPASFLSNEDRKLFSALVDYKLLEMNLATTLTARIGWRPEKTRSAIGPVVTCNTCGYLRSVTVMAAGGQCGLCAYLVEAAKSTASPDTPAYDIATNVSTSDATWVECSMAFCRAQYVVYHTNQLNVRPKCHYCRFSGSQGMAGLDFTESSVTSHTTAPYVECTTCLSRIIWPEEYRSTSDTDPESYQCPACQAGGKTVVDMDVTARQLMKESSDTNWLLRNDNQTIPEPFNGRTLFHVISTAAAGNASNTHVFSDNVAILPMTDPTLTLGGKRIRNASEIITQLQRWIASRRTQSHTCSLCFSNFKPAQLRPACGRKGCVQRICDDCQTSWYGLNARGRIINIAALHCPFCRRLPRPGVVESVRRRAGNDASAVQDRHGRQSIVFVGNLAAAIEEQGSWIYAWCASCGNARQFAERACARGAPPQLTDWVCLDCPATRRHDAAGASRTYEATVVIKSCPGCGIPTERIDGCGHVQCEIDGCGVHWCFFCGEQQEEDEIYEHMEEVHGGIFGEVDEEEGDY